MEDIAVGKSVIYEVSVRVCHDSAAFADGLDGRTDDRSAVHLSDDAGHAELAFHLSGRDLVEDDVLVVDFPFDALSVEDRRKGLVYGSVLEAEFDRFAQRNLFRIVDEQVPGLLFNHFQGLRNGESPRISEVPGIYADGHEECRKHKCELFEFHLYLAINLFRV